MAENHTDWIFVYSTRGTNNYEINRVQISRAYSRWHNWTLNDQETWNFAYYCLLQCVCMAAWLIVKRFWRRHDLNCWPPVQESIWLDKVRYCKCSRAKIDVVLNLLYCSEFPVGGGQHSEYYLPLEKIWLAIIVIKARIVKNRWRIGILKS